MYGEILEADSAHYPSPEDAAAIGKDFPHKTDELTKKKPFKASRDKLSIMEEEVGMVES